MIQKSGFLFSSLTALFLLLVCSSPYASSGEGADGLTDAQPKLGSAYADSSLPIGFSQEVSLWPVDSKVLKDGINRISKDEYAKNNPQLVITHPTFLLYAPKAHSSRAAIIVFPGGGYKAVAMGKNSTIGFNGADVCEWLTGAGVTCIILKYRVPNSGCNWNAKTRRHETPDIPMALQDAQRAISIVRYNAEKYGIDPNKIGVMGFSAGGNLAVLSSTAFKKRAYEPIDEIDQVSHRPDFAIPVYPGHLTMEHKNKTPKAIAARELNTDIEISADIPPTLLIHAEDDPVDPVHYSKVYNRELMKAGVNVKLIRYKTGGHAFGVKKQGKDTDRWTVDALGWLKDIRIL
jgi:acetyl esterase/lipase